MLDGLKHALTIKPFWLYLLVSFIGLGIFNGITTWVENIIRPRGFSPTDAGTLGALMIVGGVIGAVGHGSAGVLAEDESQDVEPLDAQGYIFKKPLLHP